MAEEGTWFHLNPVRGELPVHEDARYTIVRYGNVHFLPGFGEALTKVAQPWIDSGAMDIGSWPPEREATRIVVHGIGTRLVRVVFWEHVRLLDRRICSRTYSCYRMASYRRNSHYGSTKRVTSSPCSMMPSSGVSPSQTTSKFGSSMRPSGRRFPRRQHATWLPCTQRSVSGRATPVLLRASDGKSRNSNVSVEDPLASTTRYVITRFPKFLIGD